MTYRRSDQLSAFLIVGRLTSGFGGEVEEERSWFSTV